MGQIIITPDGRREENLPSDVPLFAFIGRLAKVKGLSFLLDAFAIVQSERPDALLLIIGGGEEERRLRLECAQKNLNASVLFYGPLPPARVASLLRAADVCVVTSLEEGFSAAMLEEVASGKPIVSTAVSGAGELIVEGKNGFVVDSRDERLFAKRMLEALNLPDASTVSRDIALRYADRTVWKTVAEAWAPLKGVIADD